MRRRSFLTTCMVLASLPIVGPVMGALPSDASPATTERPATSRLPASTHPAMAPATEPASQPVRLQTPPGCVRIELNGRVMFTDPADEAWVREVALHAPRGVPTTQASDLLARFAARRDPLSVAMLGDLPTLLPKDVDAFLDGEFRQDLVSFAQVQAYPVFLVVSEGRLTEIVRQGWSEPHFHYNRQADQVDIERGVSIQAGHPVESAVAALIDPKGDPTLRAAKLADTVSHTELVVNQSIAARSTAGAVRTMARFLSKHALADLPHGVDELWFGTGLVNVLAGRYVAMLHGAPLGQFMAEMIRPPRQGPIDEATVNLLHPYAPDDLRPELVDAYAQACYRKAIAVMFLWVEKAGIRQVAPVLEEIKRFPPADGPTLVKLIENRSGVDLTPILTGRLRPL
ncbi:MAG: hypothetical protein ACTHLZ_01315 [Tepidisphaeraceae bacterium]